MVYGGISCDSRTVRPGDLFVAVPGVRDDGAKYAREAVMRGAAAVASAVPIEGLGVENIVVEGDIRKWLGEMAAKHNGMPSEKLDVFGITGTNGKTTTTWILAEFLKAGGRNPGYVTTVETYTGRRKFESAHTTPGQIELQGLFAEMVSSGLDSAVMEVSSHAAVQSRTAGTRFAGAGFTNLTEDHLDYHGTMESYYAAKRDWLISLGAVPICVCVDGPYGKRLLDELKIAGCNAIACGYEADSPDFIRYVEKMSPLAGRYNVENVLLAAALARVSGVSEDAIMRAVPNLKPRWGRLERVPTLSRAEVFVDFAHTDDALANVLSTVKSFAKGNVWAVFGAGGDRDRAKRPLMGAAAAKWADRLVVTSDNPRSENPESIIDEILSGIPSGKAFVRESDRRKAINLALSEAGEGDVVVICGKGHETTQEINGVKHPFDDREVARNCGIYAVKMRSSQGSVHISGAERIVPASAAPDVAAALVKRALSHPRGAPDYVNVKLEAPSMPIERLRALDVTTHEVATPEEGMALAAKLLEEAGIGRVREAMEMFRVTGQMRGAMLLDADTLERLESDKMRGVRATYMDSCRGASIDALAVKNHFAEAIVLATKVANAPHIVGELCVSDDPGYVTGYVASKSLGYRRITKMKEIGDPFGGRIFFFRGPRSAVTETVEYLEKRWVLVEDA